VDDVRAIAKACDAAGVPLYLDGARIFNACTVTGATIADYASQVTAMMFCLSKGVSRLAAEGLRTTVVAGKVRMLTHRDVCTEDIVSAVGAWRRAAAP